MTLNIPYIVMLSSWHVFLWLFILIEINGAVTHKALASICIGSMWPSGYVHFLGQCLVCYMVNIIHVWERTINGPCTGLRMLAIFSVTRLIYCDNDFVGKDYRWDFSNTISLPPWCDDWHVQTKGYSWYIELKWQYNMVQMTISNSFGI